MKTAQEVQELKDQWLFDPIFDLEETPGFEDYKDELRAFRVEKEASWKEQRERDRKRAYLDYAAFAAPPAFHADGSMATDPQEGLSRREYFVAMAMQGLIAQQPQSSESIAVLAVKIADAVLDRLYRLYQDQ